VADWKTQQHLEDHYELHRRELRVRSIEEYDASAQDTIVIGVTFTYRDRRTGEPRVGYFHRDSSRFAATDVNGLLRTHYRTDEAHVAGLPRSTYRD
jgi:hypothetical protein